MLGLIYPAVGFALGRLDPEKAHNLTIAALENFPVPACAADDMRLATSVMGLDFPNPVGMAAGFDKDGRVPDALMQLGFGFVEIGGVTKLPQPGNPRPRVFRLTEDEAVINRYGLNSAGMDVVAARLAKRRHAGRLGINLGANKDSTDRIGDYAELTRRLCSLADFLTLNVSSPNTPGLRDLQARVFLDELLARVLDARGSASTRILLKIAPDIDEHQLDDIVDVAQARGIDGLVVSNTTIARPQSLRNHVTAREAGGLSGRPLFAPSTILLAKTFLRVRDRLPIIGVGGISSGEDAISKIAAGASLVQLYTALVFQGPKIICDIKGALIAEMKRCNAGHLSGMIGRDAEDWARRAL